MKPRCATESMQKSKWRIEELQKSTNEMRWEQMEKVNERISQLQNNTKIIMAVSLILLFGCVANVSCNTQFIRQTHVPVFRYCKYSSRPQ